MIKLERTTSDNEGFKELIRELDKELWSNYEERQGIYDQHNVVNDNRNVIVASIEGALAAALL